MSPGGSGPPTPSTGRPAPRWKPRKAEGCLAVDMEVAGVQAVCSFHGFQLYCFLMTGDVLDLPEWDVAELGEANHSMDNLKLALKLAAAV